jgi:hypothetical protein
VSLRPAFRITPVRPATFAVPASQRDHVRWPWEQAFSGTPNQVRHVRAMVGPLLYGCPAADDIILVLSELFFLRSGCVPSQVHTRSFSYLPAASSCGQRHASSLPVAARQATEADLRASSSLMPVPRRPLWRIPANSRCPARHRDPGGGERGASADTHNRSGRRGGAVIAQLEDSPGDRVAGARLSHHRVRHHRRVGTAEPGHACRVRQGAAGRPAGRRQRPGRRDAGRRPLCRDQRAARDAARRLPAIGRPERPGTDRPADAGIRGCCPRRQMRRRSPGR